MAHDVLKYWLKIDHIAFLAILPAIILDIKYLALIFWFIAFFYEIYEQKKKRKWLNILKR